MKKIQNRLSGYSLFELLLTLTLIAVISTLAYPAYQQSILHIRRIQAKTALYKIMYQQERFYTRNASYMPFSAASPSPDNKVFVWWSGENPQSSFYEISATACNQSNIRSCILLTASPGTSRVNSHFSDPVCDKLISGRV